MSKNLVLTSVYGLSADEVEPFFSSLRLSGYDGNVVVFASQISPDCRKMLAKHDATILDFESLGLQVAYASLVKRLVSLPKAVYRAYWKHRRDVRCLIVNCWRFFGIQEYLASLQQKPEFLLLADVRDVVFQANPFVFKPGLSVASECVRGTIAESRANSKWLWEVAGYKEMRRLGPLTPVCSGTIAADYDTAVRYVDLMTRHLNKSYFWGLSDAIDQGLHNYIAHNGLIQPMHLFKNWNGPFLTLDSETVLPRHKNQDGHLCNEDGSIVPIVHQYDRISNLYKKGDPVPPCWEFYAR